MTGIQQASDGTTARIRQARPVGRIAGPDRPGHRALAARHDGRLVGRAEYGFPTGTTTGISPAVADDWHHRGIAALGSRVRRSVSHLRPVSAPAAPTGSLITQEDQP